jgi:RND family efflux transporter MFP subunit
MIAEAAQNGNRLDSLRIARTKEKPRRRKNPWSSSLPIVLLLLIVGIAAYAVYLRTAGRPPVVQTTMVQATLGNQPGVVLTGSGYVVTRHKYITIGTKILGQIVEEPIEEGQHVKVGDILARIDDRDYQAQLRQAIANRDLAEANVRLKMAQEVRIQKLNGSGAVSTDDYDTAINAADVAQASLKSFDAAIDYAKFNVDQCVITSPIDGIVLQKFRELGDTINFGGEIQTGGGATDIAQLADTSDMRAEVDINEADIAKVGLGTVATVVPDAYSDQKFNATLVKVYPAADRQKGTIKIEVHIEKPDLQFIKPEMSVKVSFLESKPTATEPPRLVIPKSAVLQEGAQSYAWTLRNGAARRANLLCGRETETGVEVKQGLTDGDIVIVAPPIGLTDGETVTAGQAGTDSNN